MPQGILAQVTVLGQLMKAMMRVKLMFTGEGRAGKTTTRKALKKMDFNAAEPSTCGASSHDYELTLQKEDVEDWQDYVPPPDQHQRVLAEFIAAIQRGEMTVDELSAKGLDGVNQGFLGALEAKLAQGREKTNSRVVGEEKEEEEEEDDEEREGTALR